MDEAEEMLGDDMLVCLKHGDGLSASAAALHCSLSHLLLHVITVNAFLAVRRVHRS